MDGWWHRAWITPLHVSTWRGVDSAWIWNRRGGGLVKVGAKVAGECNFAPTFVRHSRFSSRSSTRAASNIRREYLGRFDFTDRELVCRRRIIVFCVGFCWSGFAPFFLSLSLSPRYFCVFVFDARTKKKFLIGSWARYRSLERDVNVCRRECDIST